MNLSHTVFLIYYFFHHVKDNSRKDLALSQMSYLVHMKISWTMTQANNFEPSDEISST